MTNFYVPVLNGQSLPMPTTFNSTPYSTGVTLYSPTGTPRTQRHYTGEIFAFTWNKLSDTDRSILKGRIDGVGFSPVTLLLTDGSTEVTVIPNSFEAYSEEKFEHYLADTVRWNVSMTWKEVP